MIRSGPRWNALVVAANGALTSFQAPLLEEERRAGWTDDDVDRALEQLKTFGSLLRMRPDVLPSVPSLNDLGASTTELERVALLSEIDFSVSELEMADRTLAAEDHLLDWMATPSGSVNEVGADTRDSIRRVAMQIRDRLELGECLSRENLYAWGELLASLG